MMVREVLNKLAGGVAVEVTGRVGELEDGSCGRVLQQVLQSQV